MRIKEDSLINVVQTKGYISHHVDFLTKACIIDPLKEDVYKNKIGLFQESNFRKLIFSKKSIENLENYVVPKEVRVDVLRTLPNRNDIIHIDERNCIQYKKTDELLLVSFHYTKENDPMIYLYYFEVNLVTGKITTDDKRSDSNEDMNLDKMIEYFYSRFLVVVTYLELTDVTYDILLGGMSFGTNKQGKVKNDTRNKYILVNTNWNTTIVRLDEFSVRGHYRLQPCGVGRKQYKYIFIEPYTKGGIKRLAKKMTTGQVVSEI
jgi:hypothetical protein